MNSATNWSPKFSSAIAKLWAMPPMTQSEYSEAARSLAKKLNTQDAKKLLRAAGC